MLAMDAGPRINSQAISAMLQFLVESPDFDFETYVFKEDRVFYLALLAINYQSEKIIFLVSMYSKRHISRKRLMRGMHVFSLSGGSNWSVAPSTDKRRWAIIKLSSGLAIS